MTALLFAPRAVFANRKFFREITKGLMLRSVRYSHLKINGGERDPAICGGQKELAVLRYAEGRRLKCHCLYTCGNGKGQWR